MAPQVAENTPNEKEVKSNEKITEKSKTNVPKLPEKGKTANNNITPEKRKISATNNNLAEKGKLPEKDRPVLGEKEKEKNTAMLDKSQPPPRRAQSLQGTNPSIRTRSQNRAAGKQNGQQHYQTVFELNELQTMVSFAIQEGNSGTVTKITARVAKLVSELRRGVQGSEIPQRDLRFAIIATLSKNLQRGQIFRRDPTNYTLWKFSDYNPWMTATQAERDLKFKEVSSFISTSKDIQVLFSPRQST